MKKTNVKCPLCGTINRNLYLEETGGWMECERCGSITKGIVCTAKISILYFSTRIILKPDVLPDFCASLPDRQRHTRVNDYEKEIC